MVYKALSNSGGGGGISGITFTDGINTVANATELIVSGGTIGGSTPNATLTITGGSGINRLISAISINTSAASASDTDYVYICRGSLTITLPTAVGNGNLYTVKLSGTGTVQIATSAGQLIDGASTATLYQQYQSLSFISDSANWSIV